MLMNVAVAPHTKLETCVIGCATVSITPLTQSTRIVFGYHQRVLHTIPRITAGAAGNTQRQRGREQADWQGPRQGSHLGQREEVATRQHKRVPRGVEGLVSRKLNGSMLQLDEKCIFLS